MIGENDEIDLPLLSALNCGKDCFVHGKLRTESLFCMKNLKGRVPSVEQEGSSGGNEAATEKGLS